MNTLPLITIKKELDDTVDKLIDTISTVAKDHTPL
jgi:hypothetical protein